MSYLTNPTVSTDDAAQRFAESLQAAAQARQQEASEAERQRKLMEGELLMRIDEMDLSKDQLAAIAEFVANGCVTVTDDTLTERNEAMQQEIVELRTEIGELRQQNQTLGGDNTIAFTDADEKAKAEFILDKFRNGNSQLQDNQTVTNRLRRPQRRQQQTGPTGPPTQQQPTADDDTPSPDDEPKQPNVLVRMMRAATASPKQNTE